MENLYRINLKASTFFFSLIIFLSCQSDAEYCSKYGSGFNAQRDSLGLVELDSNWILKTTLHEIGYTCIWSKDKKYGYSQKEVELSKRGEILKETDKYFLGYFSQFDRDDTNEYEVYKFLTYDYNKSVWFSGTWGEVNDMPNYDVSTSLFHRDIDYLHFNKGIPWVELPRVDSTLFPLLRR